MEPAIKVEGIGKKYVISHKNTMKYDNNLQHLAVLAKQLTHPIRSSSKEDFWALKDVSFDVQPGESIGLIGKNGAGKSTMLKLISRITEPTTGRIEINGTVSSMLEVGTGFNKELTGRENIYLNGAILGMRRSEIDKKFDTIVEFSEIDKFIDTPVKRYSSGMFVRLAFAVASHLEPDIMVVDEVLAVGDSRFQKKCLEQMAQSAQTGRTVIYVSHNMATIRQLCNRTIFLEKGQVSFIGDVDEGIDHYLANGGGNELVKDVSDHPDNYWASNEAHITKVEMLDTTDCVYAYDAPIKFRVTVYARSDISKVTMRVDVTDRNHDYIGMSFSEPIGDMKKGCTYEMEFSMADHRLAPDSYSATLALSTGNNFGTFSSLDIIEHILQFDVLGMEVNGLRETWTQFWGHMHIPPIETTSFKQIESNQ